MSEYSDFRRSIPATTLAIVIIMAGIAYGFNPAVADEPTQDATVQERSAKGAAVQSRGIEKSDIRRGHAEKEAKSDGYKTDAGNALNARGTDGAAPRRAGDPVPGTTAEDDW